MSGALQARANLELGFAVDAGGVTRLSRRFARYPWSLTRPFWIDRAPSGMASVIPQSANSLLLPGDRVEQRIALDEGAAAHITSQGAQAVHGVPDGPTAASIWSLSLATGAFLEVILDPVILFPHSRLEQRFDATLEADSCLILSDGATWHPEVSDPAFACMDSRLILRSASGHLRAKERNRLLPEQVRSMATASGRLPLVSGQLWVLLGSPPVTDFAMPRIEDPSAYCASSPLPNGTGFLLRFLCYEVQHFAAMQRSAWRKLRQALHGALPTDRRKSS